MLLTTIHRLFYKRRERLQVYAYKSYVFPAQDLAIVDSVVQLP